MAKKRKRRRTILMASIPFVMVLLGVCYNNGMLDGYLGAGNKKSKQQQRKGNHRTRDDYDYNKHNSPAVLEAVEGYLTLINLSIPTGALVPKANKASRRKQLEEGRYKNVKATLCRIDWSLQAENPSTVPMFRDLQAQSKDCSDTKVVVDFYDLVRAAKRFDGYGDHDRSIQEHHQHPSVVPPKGVVFHETRCGSTLFANLLAGFAPRGNSRVYSESPPPLAALRACEGTTDCDPELQKALIRDTFYVMGRRRPVAEEDDGNDDEDNKGEKPKEETERHMFFKIQSIGVMNIDKFTMAFPEVPWVFVYRDAVEILQSHLKQGSRASPKVCARSHKAPPDRQPATTLAVIRDSGKRLGDLGAVEYCAAHLAGLSLSAVREYDRQENEGGGDRDVAGGRFVGYDQMPGVVWGEVLPDHFGINPMPRDAVPRMEELAGVYSKGRGPKANKEWNEDSTRKQETAGPEVIAASELFASKVYRRMSKLSE